MNEDNYGAILLFLSFLFFTVLGIAIALTPNSPEDFVDAMRHVCDIQNITEPNCSVYSDYIINQTIVFECVNNTAPVKWRNSQKEYTFHLLQCLNFSGNNYYQWNGKSE